MLGSDESGFGDKHTLEVVSAVLNGRKVSVISSADKRIADHAEALQGYHRQLRGGLLGTLRGPLSNKVVVEDAVSFLMDAYESGHREDGMRVLRAVERDTALKHYDRDDLGAILLNTTKNQIPAEWLIATFGTLVDPEDVKQDLNPHDWKQGADQNASGLNIDAMRDFK